MRSLGAAVAAVLLWAAAAAAASPAQPVPAGLSWSLAESLAAKIKTLEAQKRPRPRTRKPASVLVTEAELNSYLNLTLGPQLPAGVNELRVRLDSERIEASGNVDLSLVREHVPSGRFNLLGLLGGEVPVLLRGRLRNQDGFGSLEWEEVTLASLPVPITVLGQVVARSTRTAANPEGFDIEAPFRLPYALRRIRLEPGRAMLDY